MSLQRRFELPGDVSKAESIRSDRFCEFLELCDCSREHCLDEFSRCARFRADTRAPGRFESPCDLYCLFSLQAGREHPVRYFFLGRFGERRSRTDRVFTGLPIVIIRNDQSSPPVSCLGHGIE